MKNLFKNLPAKSFAYFLLFTLFSFYLMDLGNPQALTQGTEGFYLKITKEMYEAKSILTPLYLGQPHWSKPPLHFWMPFPFYLLGGGFSLWAARLCMLLLTWGGMIYISRWLFRQAQIDKFLSLIFLASTLVFFKYARIYMMEAPLAIFSTCAALSFYDFLTLKKKASFWIATLFLTCATLIKGPVALVMAAGGMGLTVIYFHLVRKENHWRPLVLWGIFSTILASLWFIACYIKYGSTFFDYFFLRENMGKFSSKAYPMSSLFKGLLSYSLPWILFLPLALYHIYKKVHPLFDLKRSPLLPFLGLHFLVFFILWLIPNQRSYHYAVPSIPFLLLIIMLGIFAPPSRTDEDDTSSKLTNIVWVISGVVTLLLSGLCIFVLAFAGPMLTLTGYLKALATLIIILISFVILMRRIAFEWKMSACLWVIGAVWTLFIPIFFLPLVPSDVAEIVAKETNQGKEKESLAVIYRKPFFVEEVIQSPIKVYDASEVSKTLCKHPLTFMPEWALEKSKLQNKVEILKRWPIWKRGNETSDFIQAYEKKNLSLLQENMVLVRGKACYKNKHEH